VYLLILERRKGKCFLLALAVGNARNEMEEGTGKWNIPSIVSRGRGAPYSRGNNLNAVASRGASLAAGRASSMQRGYTPQSQSSGGRPQRRGPNTLISLRGGIGQGSETVSGLGNIVARTTTHAQRPQKQVRIFNFSGSYHFVIASSTKLSYTSRVNNLG